MVKYALRAGLRGLESKEIKFRYGYDKNLIFSIPSKT
jgi:hypothetical protein